MRCRNRIVSYPTILKNAQHGILPIAALVLVTSVPVVHAETVPATDIKALDGTSVVFPKKSGAKPLFLMLGFSHKSSGDFDRWKHSFKTNYIADPRVDFYELVDLQGVPSFVKGMIQHGMRREIKKPEQSHFAPFFTNEAEWKKLVNYSNPDDAYLVVADPAGNIIWQYHGAITQAKVSELEDAVGKAAVASR